MRRAAAVGKRVGKLVVVGDGGIVCPDYPVTITRAACGFRSSIQESIEGTGDILVCFGIRDAHAAQVVLLPLKLVLGSARPNIVVGRVRVSG